MNVKDKIKEIVDVIYTPDKKGFDTCFIQLLDALEQSDLLVKHNIDSILVMLQKAYVNKDYVGLADILLYDLEPVVDEGL